MLKDNVSYKLAKLWGAREPLGTTPNTLPGKVVKTSMQQQV